TPAFRRLETRQCLTIASEDVTIRGGDSQRDRPLPAHMEMVVRGTRHDVLSESCPIEIGGAAQMLDEIDFDVEKQFARIARWCDEVVGSDPKRYGRSLPYPFPVDR